MRCVTALTPMVPCMLPRNPDTDAFWQAFRDYAGLDHDNYVVGSFGASPEMATELADLVVAGIKRATASLARDYGEGLGFSARAPFAFLIAVAYLLGAATGGSLFALLRRSVKGSGLSRTELH